MTVCNGCDDDCDGTVDNGDSTVLSKVDFLFVADGSGSMDDSIKGLTLFTSELAAGMTRPAGALEGAGTTARMGLIQYSWNNAADTGSGYRTERTLTDPGTYRQWADAFAPTCDTDCTRMGGREAGFAILWKILQDRFIDENVMPDIVWDHEAVPYIVIMTDENPYQTVAAIAKSAPTDIRDMLGPNPIAQIFALQMRTGQCTPDSCSAHWDVAFDNYPTGAGEPSSHLLSTAAGQTVDGFHDAFYDFFFDNVLTHICYPFACNPEVPIPEPEPEPEPVDPDCSSCPHCGDGICQASEGETGLNCSDCAVCGNGVCEREEGPGGAKDCYNCSDPAHNDCCVIY